MSNETRNIAIIGAGPVGCLLSVYLCRRGYQVTLIDKRKDFRKHRNTEGRSINMALSSRGLAALREVNLDERALQNAVPMFGRMIHGKTGELTVQPYGTAGQHINSIDRNSINVLLLERAIDDGAVVMFERQCIAVDHNTNQITTECHGLLINYSFDFIIGADGAHSTLRKFMSDTDRVHYSLRTLDYGYKELHVPSINNRASFQKNYLHIWPRESFMLIALPNPDNSFTCTLFLPLTGEHSFEKLTDQSRIRNFFEKNFSDAIHHMPSLTENFKQNPIVSLEMVDCYPWSTQNVLLIGDAAHAIFPFYGQGMNAGFEDCRILNEILNRHNGGWEKAVKEFQALRKPDTDAIAFLSHNNFHEMREQVADKRFIIRKKIEGRLHERYPQRWTPLYSMITFQNEITYSQAVNQEEKQKRIMDDVMKNLVDADQWENLDFEKIAGQLPPVTPEVPSGESCTPHNVPSHHERS